MKQTKRKPIKNDQGKKRADRHSIVENLGRGKYHFVEEMLQNGSKE
jgi:hypothetical protein